LAGMASLKLYKRTVYCLYQNQPFLHQNQSFPTLIYIHFFRYGLQREFGRKSTPKYASPCVFSYLPPLYTERNIQPNQRALPSFSDIVFRLISPFQASTGPAFDATTIPNTASPDASTVPFSSSPWASPQTSHQTSRQASRQASPQASPSLTPNRRERRARD